jgi:hypothetical protein
MSEGSVNDTSKTVGAVLVKRLITASPVPFGAQPRPVTALRQVPQRHVTDPNRHAGMVTPNGKEPPGLAHFSSGDLRAYAGVAPVGSWAALNAERECGEAPRGVVHSTVFPPG